MSHLALGGARVLLSVNYHVPVMKELKKNVKKVISERGCTVATFGGSINRYGSIVRLGAGEAVRRAARSGQSW